MKMSSLIKLSVLSYVVTYLALTVEIPYTQPSNQTAVATFAIGLTMILILGLLTKDKQK